MLRRADEYKEQVGRQVDRLKEFQAAIAELVKWLDGMETHSGFTVPSCASIQQMKVHFEHVKVSWESFVPMCVGVSWLWCLPGYKLPQI